MDKLRAIELFVQLAELGSFTRVAARTNCSKSMVSKEIGKLEANLGARLLHRSTRNVGLTHAGEAYLERAKEIIDKLKEADNFVLGLRSDLKGKLKINAPMALGLSDLDKLFADFMIANPAIELDIHLGDEGVDLVEQGFDIGFRASSKPIDSNYIGKPLAKFSYRVCASPNYLQGHAKINHPDDLQAHNCFVYSYFQGRNLWPIEGGVRVNGNLRVNSTPFMMEAIKRGLGIGLVPEFVCRSAIESGEVVELLAASEKSKLTLYALYPARHFVPASVVQCIEYFQQWFAEDRH